MSSPAAEPSSTPYPSDVVNYSGAPSAPLIIPIVFFAVVIIGLILTFIKLMERLWNRKRKSDTYVFVEANDDHKLHYTVDDKTDGNIPLTYLTVRRTSSNGNIGTVNANYDHVVDDSPHMRVEANVHQNSSHLFDDNPLNNRNATESDV